MVLLLLLLTAVAPITTTTQSTAPTSAPVVALAPPLLKVRPDRPYTPTTARGRFTMAAARNEYESIQVVVSRPNASVSGVELVFVRGASQAGLALLNRSGSGGSTQVHRAAYIDIRTVSDCDGALGRWPDALIPVRDPWFGELRNALPAKVAGLNAVFWVDVFVHPRVPAGEYAAEVVVPSRSPMRRPNSHYGGRNG